MAHLRGLGYQLVLGSHALDRGPLYYAGTLAHRLEDLHAAFAELGKDASGLDSDLLIVPRRTGSLAVNSRLGAR